MKLTTRVSFRLIALAATFTVAAHAQTFRVIHAFTGAQDGAYPQSGVTLRGGNLYGTTGYPNFGENGNVYELVHSGNTWVAKSIYAFSGPDGRSPLARVVFGPDGHLYGTASAGGIYNKGLVFELLPPKVNSCKTPSCGWTETVIHEFQGYPGDGWAPYHGDLIWDHAGNMYGMTFLGGAYNYGGTVFELQPSANGWTASVIDYPGYTPLGGPALDDDNHLFGTVAFNGPDQEGTIFGLTYIEGVGWQGSYGYAFSEGDSLGFQPLAGLVADKAGNFYGSTSQGAFSNNLGGTVFELSPSGNTWTLTKLYAFPQKAGCGPQAALTLDDAGVLYGTTWCNGAYGQGNVFKLTKTANGWVYTSLYDFTGGNDGCYPMSNVTIDTDGTLYGTTSGGDGTCGGGTVWMIKP